jgi:hypothetical protein
MPDFSRHPFFWTLIVPSVLSILLGIFGQDLRKTIMSICRSGTDGWRNRRLDRTEEHLWLVRHLHENKENAVFYVGRELCMFISSLMTAYASAALILVISSRPIPTVHYKMIVELIVVVVFTIIGGYSMGSSSLRGMRVPQVPLDAWFFAESSEKLEAKVAKLKTKAMAAGAAIV